jgi:hypothetical protein
MVTDFLDKTVEARFKRDVQGRLVFFPWGFGTGRIVPDAMIEADLRRACRRLMIGIFVVAIPAISIFNAIYKPTGFAFLAYIMACAAFGFAAQLYPVWLSRDLSRSDERMTYPAAMQFSLDRFGRKFLIFGLVSSMLFVASSAMMLLLPPAEAVDRFTMIICMMIFAPLAAVYAVALWRRRGEGSMA